MSIFIMKYSNTAPIHVLYHSYSPHEIYIIMALVSFILLLSIGFLFRGNGKIILATALSLLLCSYINVVNFNNSFNGKRFLLTDVMINQAEEHYHLKYADEDSKILPNIVNNVAKSSGDYWVYLSGGEHVKCKTIVLKSNDKFLDAYVKCHH